MQPIDLQVSCLLSTPESFEAKIFNYEGKLGADKPEKLCFVLNKLVKIALVQRLDAKPWELCTKICRASYEEESSVISNVKRVNHTQKSSIWYLVRFRFIPPQVQHLWLVNTANGALMWKPFFARTLSLQKPIPCFVTGTYYPSFCFCLLPYISGSTNVEYCMPIDVYMKK